MPKSTSPTHSVGVSIGARARPNSKRISVWDNEFLYLVEEAHFTFRGTADGEIAFGALKGFLDVRYGSLDGSACAEFSWEGYDENDPACDRGWVVIGTAGRLVGHFYIHNGEDSGFVCQRH